MGVSNYANVYARIRARMSDILEEGKVKELVDTRPADFVSSLMDTAYKDQLTKASVVMLDARSIEKALKAELVNQYVMVLRTTKGATRDIFKEILRRLEVKNLKAILRAKTAKGPRSTQDILMFPVETVFRRRMSRLLEVESVEDVIHRVESPYKEVLESVLPEYEATPKTFVLENALDAEISGAVWNRIEKLRGDDKEIVRQIVGTELDLINLMTLLRCKAEEIPEGELRSFLLPYVYTVDFGAEAMNESVSAENIGAAIRSMPSSVYRDLLTRALPVYESEKTLIPFEDALWRYFSRIVKKTLKGYPINIGTTIGFLYLKEIEIRNLCAIAVGKENELPAEEIEKLIITS